MKKRVNFLGRKDIPSDFVKAMLSNLEVNPTLKLSWDFSSLHFDPSSRIILDLTFSGTMETDRIDLGPTDKGIGECTLDVSQYRNPRRLKVRIKIVTEDEDGLRLNIGGLENIDPEIPEDAQAGSLLRMVEDQSLEILWDFRIDEGVPTLFLSGQNDFFNLLRHELKDYFEPLILPEVVRRTFVWLASSEDFQRDDIVSLWEDFFERLGFMRDDFVAFRGQAREVMSGESDDTSTDFTERVDDEALRWAGVFCAKESFFQKVMISLASEGA